jgi:hypothetical protein
MNTPLFPAWRSRLAAYGRRTRQRRCASELENEFAQFLPPALLLKTARGAGSRNRVFTRARTFWCFIWQVLQPQTACRAVVRKMQAEGESQRRTFDESSSAYCQARKRLPLTTLQRGLEHSAQCAEHRVRGSVLGWHRPVKVVDATSFQTPDTPANREQYHYPPGQKKGCGFPVMRALALFSLASGAIERLVTAACCTAELVMLKPLWSVLKRGDILLGDRVYGCFALLAALPLQGVDVVARLHQARCLNLRRARKLGPDQWQTTLPKPSHPPPYIPQAEWDQLPLSIPVRILRIRVQIKGFRTKKLWIVTTLLDVQLYTQEALAELYVRRWQMELTFRDLKTTMGMETLRCRTPDMVEKEIRLFLIAHNFLRALMATAAAPHDLSPHRISFKGTVDTIRSFHPAMLHAPSTHSRMRLRRRLLAILYADRLPLRPNRSEPRAIKKRPKPYPLLTKPRHIFKALPHKGQTRAKRPQVILT